MKKGLLLVIGVLLGLQCFAQAVKFPDGIYLTVDQLRNRTPELNTDMRVKRRSSLDIQMAGSNDYDIRFIDRSVRKKYKLKDVYAYVRNDSVYLNCYQHDLQPLFAVALTQGNFLAFKGAIPKDEAAMYSLVGGSITGLLMGVSPPSSRYLYVLSLKTGNVRLLSKKYMLARLTSNQRLLEAYTAENNPDSEETLIKYVNILNEVPADRSEVSE